MRFCPYYQYGGSGACKAVGHAQSPNAIAGASQRNPSRTRSDDPFPLSRAVSRGGQPSRRWLGQVDVRGQPRSRLDRMAQERVCARDKGRLISTSPFATLKAAAEKPFLYSPKHCRRILVNRRKRLLTGPTGLDQVERQDTTDVSSGPARVSVWNSIPTEQSPENRKRWGAVRRA